LISEDYYQLLSPEFKDLTRIVDRVLLKGQEQPKNIYRVDIDLQNGKHDNSGFPGKEKSVDGENSNLESLGSS
jgi:hypothetical protein